MTKPSVRLQRLMDTLCDFPDELFNREIQDALEDAWGKMEDAQLHLQGAGL
jgi:hypothetical protein